ncbi:hypothetical protein PAN31117_05069 [Pandoraea anapnoica]|uniref:Uncharacterized protein n=1 Tax=Pandoraea anapnoica TaxID=2508301 RepID=A0A5E5AQH0_9BURK|nr:MULTISPECIES: hypothetical protein [Pandoraea]VVE58607.1 hypothetical protein PIN31009_05331 [Pandoraea iniqua]VVE75052.1 hypothetical protein PAN31117_05069 [Pandoraea anapnoica]
MTDDNSVNVLAVDVRGQLSRVPAASLLIEFSNGQSLEFTWRQHADDPRPPSIQVWGGRVPRDEASERERPVRPYGLSIVPCASNLVTVQPRPAGELSLASANVYAVDDNDRYVAIVAESLVVELVGGRSFEIAWKNEQTASVAIYGGRMARKEWLFSEVQLRTQALAIFPLAGNVVHVHSFALQELESTTERRHPRFE